MCLLFVCFHLLKPSAAWNCEHVTSETHSCKVVSPNWHNLLLSVKRAKGSQPVGGWWSDNRDLCASECVVIVLEVWGTTVTSDRYDFSTKNVSSQCRCSFCSPALELECSAIVWILNGCSSFPLQTQRRRAYSVFPNWSRALGFLCEIAKRVIRPGPASPSSSVYRSSMNKLFFGSQAVASLTASELLHEREHAELLVLGNQHLLRLKMQRHWVQNKYILLILVTKRKQKVSSLVTNK